MRDPQVQVVVNHWILEGQVVWRRHPIKRHVSPDCRVIGGQEAAREDLDPIQFESFQSHIRRSIGPKSTHASALDPSPFHSPVTKACIFQRKETCIYILMNKLLFMVY